MHPTDTAEIPDEPRTARRTVIAPTTEYRLSLRTAPDEGLARS